MTRPTCEAPLRTAPSPYGEVTIRCARTVGVVRFRDHTGVEHAACGIHAAEMRRRWVETEGESRLAWGDR